MEIPVYATEVLMTRILNIHLKLPLNLKSSSEHDTFACSISLCKPEGSSLKLTIKVEKYVLLYVL